MTCRIVLADDQPVLRQCVKRILAERADLQVIAEAGDGRWLLDMLQDGSQLPDLIILDLSMSGLEGIEAIRRVRDLYPHIKILVLTTHEEEEYVATAFAVGAAGYLVKGNADVELLPAVSSVLQGRIYLSSRLRSQD